jgi:subtilisin family serine protease
MNIDFENNNNIVIGLIDTGVSYSQGYIKEHLLEGFNFIDINFKPIDDNGHGTRVASVMCTMINKLNCTKNIKIMPIKAVKSNGKCSVENINDGIKYAINHGVNIINLSVETDVNPPYDYFYWFSSRLPEADEY